MYNDASTLLAIIEEADFDPSKIEANVNAEIQRCEQRIREIEAMSQEEFLREISKSIFGVAQKEYYIGNLRKHIERLRDVPERIKGLLDYWKNDKWLYDHTIKQQFKGRVREMKQALEKLANNKFNAKLPSFS